MRLIKDQSASEFIFFSLHKLQEFEKIHRAQEREASSHSHHHHHHHLCLLALSTLRFYNIDNSFASEAITLPVVEAPLIIVYSLCWVTGRHHPRKSCQYHSPFTMSSSFFQNALQRTRRFLIRTTIGSAVAMGTLEYTTELPSKGRSSWFYHYVSDKYGTPMIRLCLGPEGAMKEFGNFNKNWAIDFKTAIHLWWPR